MNKQIIIAANWKMNPTSLEESKQIINNILDSSNQTNNKTILFPPFPFIYPISQFIKNSTINLGAQDCYTEISGAFTGETSISMLNSLGCSYILVGHSERRTIFNETNKKINKKINLVINEGLNCILCIGENKNEYEKGMNKEICSIQLTECLLNINENDLDKIIIAYEPVWAIGTGLNATPEIADDVHSYIRSWISNKYSEDIAKKMCILYGGSVNPDNINNILQKNNINGVLVGGASLDSNKFNKLINFKYNN